MAPSAAAEAGRAELNPPLLMFAPALPTLAGGSGFGFRMQEWRACMAKMPNRRSRKMESTRTLPIMGTDLNMVPAIFSILNTVW